MQHTIICPQCGTLAATLTVEQPSDAASTPVPEWLATFISKRCIMAPDARVGVTEFRNAVDSWTSARGFGSVSAKRLGMELQRIPGITLARASRGRRVYIGLRLR
jgi:hypothetical protein